MTYDPSDYFDVDLDDVRADRPEVEPEEIVTCLNCGRTFDLLGGPCPCHEPEDES